MLNRTPRANVVNVTALALKRFLFVIALVGVLSGALWFYQRQANCTIELRQGCINLEIARTPQQRALGLGNRQQLAQSSGMLFIYDQPQKACFWMKDTHFNLDMIWLNKQHQIIHLEANVEPASYPQTYCADDTLYVIELSTGAIANNHLAVGQQISF